MTAVPVTSFPLMFLLWFVCLQKAKKKKPKLLNKLDKTIKAEIDAAEKLRKKVQTCQNEVYRQTARVCVYQSVCVCVSGETGGGAASLRDAGAAAPTEPPRPLREGPGTPPLASQRYCTALLTHC